MKHPTKSLAVANPPIPYLATLATVGQPVEEASFHHILVLGRWWELISSPQAHVILRVLTAILFWLLRNWYFANLLLFCYHPLRWANWLLRYLFCGSTLTLMPYFFLLLSLRRFVLVCLLRNCRRCKVTSLVFAGNDAWILQLRHSRFGRFFSSNNWTPKNKMFLPLDCSSCKSRFLFFSSSTSFICCSRPYTLAGIFSFPTDVDESDF